MLALSLGHGWGIRVVQVNFVFFPYVALLLFLRIAARIW